MLVRILGLLSVASVGVNAAALVRVQAANPQSLTVSATVRNTSANCKIPAQTAGEATTRATALSGDDQNMRITQLLALKFGEGCTLIFTRTLDAENESADTPYHLTGDVTVTADGDVSVDYDRYGASVESQLEALANSTRAKPVVQITLAPAH